MPQSQDDRQIGSDSEGSEEFDGGPEAEADWDDWNGGGGDVGDEDLATSLFSPTVLPSPEAAMDHDAAQHGFDIRKYAIQERLDEYDIFRCINFVRSRVAAGEDPIPGLMAGETTAVWRGVDSFLTPVMQGDALLFYDYEDVVAAWQSDAGAAPSGGGSAADAAANAAELARLRCENEGLREALSMLAASCLPDELRAEQPSGGGDAATAAAAGGGASTSVARPAAAQRSQERAASLGPGAQEVDDSYFESYAGFGIHEEMISDTARTKAYRAALESNPLLVRGKTVLDVGCGTGILSLFACRAGARRVLSIDGSERIAGFARKICKANGYASEDGGPMSVLMGKVEELSLPEGVGKADVLVSEWMGYALLFETMLDTVLDARDRFLRPGGAVLPDIARIFVAGASAGATDAAFWKDVYGFSMAPIEQEVRKGELEFATVRVVKPEDITTCDACVKELDLCTMSAGEQDFTSEFQLTAKSPSSGASGTASGLSVEVAAVVLWFDTEFSARHCPEAPNTLSTSWNSTPTHWAQTVLALAEPVRLALPGKAPSGDDGPTADKLTGRLSMVRHKHKHRFLDISLEYSAALSDGRTVSHTAMYSMSVTAREAKEAKRPGLGS